MRQDKMEIISINGREIGVGAPCFIIAEAGVNHNGDPETARKLIDAAVESGADAVKFQTFKAEKVVTVHAPKANYQLQATLKDETQLEMLRKLELPLDVYRELKDYCQARNVLFLSTPFDKDSVNFLDELGVSLFKVGSGEITNFPLLRHIAEKRKPVILSTGMSSLVEVGQAVQQIQMVGNEQIVLLHCVSNYPADPKDSNLKAMETMRSAFKLPVGFSDHTLGIEVALAAVALGACVIEKHFTLDRTMKGPDHKASLESKDLKTLVHGIRVVESALGHGFKIPAESEANTLAIARRSLIASMDIESGTKLTSGHIDIKRPGTGLPPWMKPYLVGLTANVDISAGTILSMEMFS
jgi:N,N'-diacetyllegionaminate synthase